MARHSDCLALIDSKHLKKMNRSSMILLQAAVAEHFKGAVKVGEDFGIAVVGLKIGTTNSNGLLDISLRASFGIAMLFPPDTITNALIDAPAASEHEDDCFAIVELNSATGKTHQAAIASFLSNAKKHGVSKVHTSLRDQ